MQSKHFAAQDCNGKEHLEHSGVEPVIDFYKGAYFQLIDTDDPFNMKMLSKQIINPRYTDGLSAFMIGIPKAGNRVLYWNGALEIIVKHMRHADILFWSKSNSSVFLATIVV